MWFIITRLNVWSFNNFERCLVYTSKVNMKFHYDYYEPEVRVINRLNSWLFILYYLIYVY